MSLYENTRPALIVLVAFAPWCAAETVVRVKDGDSLVVDSSGREVEVRLADIDTPEFNQPRGVEAKEALRSLVDGKNVRLELIGGDAYRRIVARVFVDSVDVNAELGLWADEDPVPPWIWRKTKQSTERKLGAIPEVECGTKQSCGKMTSCEEAIAFLRQCKLTSIDGDGDGIPCERLCRYYR